MKYYNAEKTIAEIARILHRPWSTVYRELKRNAAVYNAEKAQKRADKLKHARRWRKLDDPALFAFVDEGLRNYFSPEQISGRLQLTTPFRISHETIYTFIWESLAAGVDYRPFLRLPKKKRRYGYKRNNKRIRNQRWIDERPAAVEERVEFGHFECDTVRGKMSSGKGIATFTERKSRLLITALLPDRSADAFIKAAVQAFRRYKGLKIRSLTVDNGMEFAKHRELEKCLKTTVYFAHPYHSWERGTNENTNGLLRQFVPKGTDLTPLTPAQLRRYENYINIRPRKCLGYRSNQEVFNEELCALRP